MPNKTTIPPPVMATAQPTLGDLASAHNIDLAAVIDPVALAVRLVGAGVPVTHAAELCDVGRTALHRKINQIRAAENNPCNVSK